MAETKKQQHDSIVYILVEHIQPGKFQPRKHFSEEMLDELINSIKAQGVIQPLILRETSKDMHEIISGERRWRASKLAGLQTVPAIIRNMNDEKAAEIALIENLQREDLNPIDEAYGYQRLIDEFNLTHQEIADRIGRSRSVITNLLRLLNLPNEVQNLLNDNLLTVGHAKILHNLPQNTQYNFACKIIDNNWSVRKTETAARLFNTEKIKTNNSKNVVLKANKNLDNSPPLSSDIQHLQDNLLETIGLPVTIDDNGQYQGTFSVKYTSFEELERILFFFTKA